MILNTESVNPESNLVVPVPEGSLEIGAELDVELRVGRCEHGDLGAHHAQHSAGDAGKDIVVQVFDAGITHPVSEFVVLALTFLWLFHCPPDSALAGGKMTELAEQICKMVEQPRPRSVEGATKQKSTQSKFRPDLHISSLNISKMILKGGAPNSSITYSSMPVTASTSFAHLGSTSTMLPHITTMSRGQWGLLMR